MTDRTFTLPELAALVEVEYRTLHTWVRKGLLRASQEEAQGSGTRNVFDRSDAVEAWVLADLRRAGVELGRLGEVAEILRDTRARRQSGATLLVNGTVRLCDDSQCVSRALAESSPTLVYDLGHATATVDDRMAASV